MFLQEKINKGSKFFVSRESRFPGLDTVLGKQEAWTKLKVKKTKTPTSGHGQY